VSKPTHARRTPRASATGSCGSALAETINGPTRPSRLIAAPPWKTKEAVAPNTISDS